MSSDEIRNHANFIWTMADLLRGDYKQSEYGKVILPLVVLRRLDCVLEPTKTAVLKRSEKLAGKIENIEPVLQAVSGEQFFNTSPLDFRRLLDDPSNIADNLRSSIGAFSRSARDIIEKFDFNGQIERLDKAKIAANDGTVVGDEPLSGRHVMTLESEELVTLATLLSPADTVLNSKDS